MNSLASYIEYSLLKPNTTFESIENLCKEALNLGFVGVCILPYYVKFATQIIKDFDIKLITVINFPLGHSHVLAQAVEAERAILDGADELDLVMNIPAFFNKDYKKVLKDIVKIVNICNEYKVILKVIIETCLLTKEQKIEASKIVCDSGADFIKTSTGFSLGGATIQDVLLLSENCQGKVKIKASGGIKTSGFARELISAGASRIGTSNGPQLMFT